MSDQDPTQMSYSDWKVMMDRRKRIVKTDKVAQKAKTAATEAKKKSSKTNKKVKQLESRMNSMVVGRAMTTRNNLRFKAGTWKKVEELIGMYSVDAFKAALMPYDCQATTGWPDGALPRGVPLNLAMNLNIAPTATMINAGGTYNVAILGLPSIHFPAMIAVYNSSTTLNWTSFFNNTSLQQYTEGNVQYVMSQPISTNTFYNTAATWNFSPLDLKRGPVVGTSATKTVTSFIPEIGLGTLIGQGGTDESVLPSTVMEGIGLTTSCQSQIQDWRCTGFSMTTDLVAPDLSNQGMVFCRPLSRTVILEQHNAAIVNLIQDNGLIPVAFYNQNPVRGYQLDGLPTNSTSLVASENTFTAPAKLGAALISRYTGGGKSYMDTDCDTGLMLFSNDSAAGDVERDSLSAAAIPMYLKINQGQGGIATSALPVPMITSIDPNWTPLITIYEGISVNATLNLKLNMKAEATPVTGSVLQTVAGKALPKNSMFTEILESTMKELPPGMESAANWEWADIGRYVRMGLEALVAAAPYLIPLL